MLLVENRVEPQKGPQTLGERAYARLCRAIVTHELVPGQKISEKMLTTKFQLSAAAVRIAIPKLIDDGLAVMRTSKTTLVAPLTLAEINSVFHMRRLLEPDAARQAAGRVDSAMLLSLDKLCQTEYKFGNTEQEFAFLEANKTFHLEIAKASGNWRQAQWIGRLQDAAMRILWLSLRVENRPKVWHQGHKDIIESLVAGNGDEAAIRALRHLEAGQMLVFEILGNSDSLGGIELTIPS